MAEFDKFASSYNSEIVKDLGRFGKYRDTAFLYKAQYLKYILPNPPGGILDFGCGVGSNAPWLKKFFPDAKLFGCDVSPESIKVAAGNHQYCEFETIAAPKDLNIYKDKVDAVFASTVFHHIPPAEHEAWINGLYSIMPIGGYLAIFEHNMKNPVTAKVVKGSKVDEEATMLGALYCKRLVRNRFCGTSTKNKKIRADRDSVKLRYTYFSPWRNALFTAMERILWFVPLGMQYCVYARKQ
ncbi:MAG: class I SAM-dependent methyltransferase [Chitinispirillales bacterium]|nr:class I SAM-dependent methyltransferase [Chitinispirillales bacterium]